MRMVSDPDSSLVTLFKGSSIIFVGRVLGLGIAFVTAILLARSLGPDGYGAITLGVTLLTFVTALAVIGLPDGISRYIPRHSEPERRLGVVISGLHLAIPTSILMSVLIILFAGPLAVNIFNDPDLIPLFRIFGMIIPIAAVINLSIATSRGNKEPVPVILLEAGVLGLGLLALVTIMITLEGGIVGIAWAYFFSYILAFLLALYYLWQQFSSEGNITVIMMRRELFFFSFPLMLTAIAGHFLQQFDIFLLGFFSSTIEVGIYQAVYPISALLFVVLGSIEFLILPILSEKHAENEYELMNHLYQVTTKWIFILGFPLFLLLMVFPQQIIELTFGPAYVDGSFTLSILTLGVMTHIVTGPNAQGLVAIGESKFILYSNVIAAIVNFVLNLILIPRYSFLGAAIATALAYGLLNVMFSLQLARIAAIQPISRDYLHTMTVSASVLAVGFLVKWYLPVDEYVTLVLISMALIAYPVLVVFIVGIQDTEATLLSAIEDRFTVNLEGIKRFLK